MVRTIVLAGWLWLFFLLSGIKAQYQNIRLSYNTLDQHETAINISSVNPKILMATWNDFRSGSEGWVEPGYCFSTDGGLNWSIENVVKDIDGDLKYGFDPSCAFNRNGTAFYCYSAGYKLANGSNKIGPIYVSRINNYFDPNDWEHQRVSTALQDQDKPFISIDNTGGSRDGNIYVSWTDYYSGTAIRFARSTNGGQSFQQLSFSLDNSEYSMKSPLKNENGDLLIGGVQGSMPAVGPNGEVYVIWHSIYGGLNASKVFIRRSLDGGLTFENSIEIGQFTKNPSGQYFGCIDIRHFPSIAVDQNTNYIYVAYEDYEGLITTPLQIECVRVKYLSNGSLDIFGPVVATSLSGNQAFPGLTVDPSGKVVFSFLQINSSTSVDCYYTESYDYIESLDYSVPYKITSTASNPNLSSHGHHYQGMISRLGMNYPLWTDYRNTKSDIYVSPVTTTPTSSSSFATASGSVRKMVYANSRWHTVIYSNKDLYHIMSTNDGTTWFGYEKMDGTTPTSELWLNDISNPSLFSNNNKLHSVFNQQDGIYYNRATYSGVWEQPKIIRYTTSPAIASYIDPNGIGHVVWVEGDMTIKSLQLYRLKYGQFNTADAIPTLTNISVVHSSSGLYYTPVIGVDNQNNPHVGWMKNNKIWYSMKTTSWSAPYEVSDGLTASETPSLYLIGTNLYITWKNGSPGEIWSRSRYSGGMWNTKTNISQSASYNSLHPSVSEVFSEPMVIWSEETSNGYDVKYYFSESGQSGILCSTDQSVQYPTYSIRSYQGVARVLGLWTEKESSPYVLKSAYKNMFPMLGKQGLKEWVTIPTDFELLPNYPNPFNPNTQISFGLPLDTRVTIKIYDVLGREVITLTEQDYLAGYHSLVWNGKNSLHREVSSGLYIIQMIAGQFKKSGKMMLLK